LHKNTFILNLLKRRKREFYPIIRSRLSLKVMFLVNKKKIQLSVCLN